MLDTFRPKGGFADLVGYALAAWQEDEAVLTMEVGKQHLNRSGVLHGGALTTLVDAACGYAGCYAGEGQPPRRAFTLSLDCNFIATAGEGATLTATARKTGGGSRIYFTQCEVRDQDGRLIGQAKAVLRYRSS